MDPSYPPPGPGGPPEGEPRDLWYIGAIINVIGSIAINLGTNLMKLGHNKRAKIDLPEKEKPPVRKFKEWVIGMSFFSVGNILNFVSFGFAAQSLLAALGSIQFVSNVIFASFVLKEKATRTVLIATTCIVAGCVLLVVFGNQSSATYTVHQLTELYSKPAYIVYMCLMGVGVVGGYLLYIHGQKVVNKTGPRGFWYAILPVAYSVYSALIGTQSVLFSKSMSVVLRLTFTGDNQLDNWYTWLVLPLFLLTAVFWITRLNKGLRMFPAMVIVPVMQIAWTLFSIVSGMLYFQEYLGFTPLKSIMFPIGVLVVFVGVFLLTQGGAPKATYQKMEEGAAKQAAKLDAAGSAFGSRPSTDLELSTRRFSDESAHSENVAITVESMPPTAPAAAPAAEGEIAAPQPLPLAPAASGLTPQTTGLTPARTGGSGSTGGFWLGEEGVPHPNTPIRGPASDGASDSPSMMDKVRGKLRSVQERLNRDLLGVEAREGFRLAMGLGDGGMPAISLFAMPTCMEYVQNPSHPMGIFSGQQSLGSPGNSMTLGPGLAPITEEGLEGRRGSVTATTPLRTGPASDALAVQHSYDSSPAMLRASGTGMGTPGSAGVASPPSPRHAHSGFGRQLIDRAESAAKSAERVALKGVEKAGRAAKTGVQLLKKAPSNIQRAVREKQGYGSLCDDEETGLLAAPDGPTPDSSAHSGPIR